MIAAVRGGMSARKATRLLRDTVGSHPIKTAMHPMDETLDRTMQRPRIVERVEELCTSIEANLDKPATADPAIRLIMAKYWDALERLARE